jgi:hypothetical protein
MVISELLSGSLFTGAQALPLRLEVWMCDLRPRFLPKGRVGPGYRAIARNGRVLLATQQSLAELVNRPAQTRLQVWHRAILPGDPAEPYGIVLCVRSNPLSAPCPIYRTRLVRAPAPRCALALELGGGLVLEFQRSGGVVQ